MRLASAADDLAGCGGVERTAFRAAMARKGPVAAIQM
jgi:hypothetical protein